MAKCRNIALMKRVSSEEYFQDCEVVVIATRAFARAYVFRVCQNLDKRTLNTHETRRYAMMQVHTNDAYNEMYDSKLRYVVNTFQYVSRRFGLASTSRIRVSEK